MQTKRVLIVDLSTANTASVVSAFTRLGTSCSLSRDPKKIAEADRVVLPGVGTFGQGMTALRDSGLDAVIGQRMRESRPTLGICLGMQLTARTSQESPDVLGLNLFAAEVTRFGEQVVVPQMGWNQIFAADDTKLVVSGFGYFANSYYLAQGPEGYTTTRSFYGSPFVASYERGPVLMCQFHPELSGAWGADILRRWLEFPEPSPLVRDLLLPATNRSIDLFTFARGVTTRVIPCLDCKDGEVVKGMQFADLRACGEPADLAAHYAKQGADEVVLLDISATQEGRSTQLQTVKRVRAVLDIPLTVGGGVTTLGDVGALLAAGADKVSINSAAVRNPGLINDISKRFGSSCTVLAIDAKRRLFGVGWEVMVRGGKQGSGKDVTSWAQEAQQRGAGEILLTSFDRDGTAKGYDLELLQAVRSAVRLPVIASGGAKNAKDLWRGIESGADAVLAASMFHDKCETVERVKCDLAVFGANVRGRKIEGIPQNLTESDAGAGESERAAVNALAR